MLPRVWDSWLCTILSQVVQVVMCDTIIYGDAIMLSRQEKIVLRVMDDRSTSSEWVILEKWSIPLWIRGPCIVKDKSVGVTDLGSNDEEVCKG